MRFLAVVLALAVAVSANIDYESKRRALQNPDLYDGDMAGIEGPFDAERNAIPGHYYRWPGAKVPYFIEPSLRNADFIKKAFDHYHKTTCIRFTPWNKEKDVIIISAGQGCYSHVGRTGGKQPLSLGKGCEFVGTAIHELGHALGLYHEQSRSDRDDYLTIYFNNVQKGMEFNFYKLGEDQNILYTPFDYGSIMIYGNDAFSKDGSPTMVAKNGQKLLNPFDKQEMTQTDIERIKKMYNC